MMMRFFMGWPQGNWQDLWNEESEISTPTDVGQYTVVFYYAGSQNYASLWTGTQFTILPPTMTVGVGSLTMQEGSTFSGVVGNFTSLGYGFTPAIDWGDGTSSAGSYTSSGNGLYVVSGSHTYSEEGSYTVLLSVTDSLGGSGSATASASVSDPAILATGGFTVNAIEGMDSGVQTIATFTDPGGPEATGDYSANIDWGDGSTSVGVIIATGTSFAVQGTHRYLEESSLDQPYTITVQITHDDSAGVNVHNTADVAQAMFIWTGAGPDNLASDPENWLPDLVPETDDTIIFNETSSRPAIIDAAFPSSIAGVEIFAGYNSQITLAENFTVTGAFYQDLSQINGTGDLTLAGSSIVSFATISTTGSATIAGGATCEVTNQFEDSSPINGTSSVESGTLFMCGSFTNSGQIDVTSGVLRIDSPGTSNGSFQVSAGGTLNFDTTDVQGPNIVLGANSSIAGDGTVTFSYAGDWTTGATVVNGSYAVGTTIVQGPVSFNANASSSNTLLGASGTLKLWADFTSTSLFLWEGGTLGVASAGAAGVLTIPAGAVLSVNAPVTWDKLSGIRNQGTMTICQGALITVPEGFGSVYLDNQGFLDILSDQVFSNPDNYLNINNTGTIEKEQDPDSGLGQGTTVFPNVYLVNSGRIIVQDGALVFQGEGRFQASTSPLLVSLRQGTSVAFSGSFDMRTSTEFLGDGSVQVLAGAFNIYASVSTPNFALLGGQVNGGTPSTIADLTVQNRFLWQGGDLSANVSIPDAGTVFISRTTTDPLQLKGIINNQGKAAWSGPVRIQLPDYNFQLAGGVTQPAVFSNPPNPVFDNQTIVDAWNNLLDAVYKAGQSQTFDGAFAQFLTDEQNANNDYNQNVASGNNGNSLANRYVAAYTQANQTYQAALQAAAQNDPTRSTTAYGDAVTGAEGTFDNAVIQAANQFVQAEIAAYQTYAGAGQAAYQQTLTNALATFNQQVAAAYVVASPSVTVAQIRDMIQQGDDITPILSNLPAESRASLFEQYWMLVGETLPYSSELVTGSAPPLNGATGNSTSIVNQLNGWFSNVSNALNNVNPVSVWDGVQSVVNTTTRFVSQAGQMLTDDPQGLLNAVVNGISNTGIVVFNSFSFGMFDSVNQQAQQIVQNSGFYRSIQVASVFAREVGITYLTMGASQLATQVGTRVIGSIATNLGVSTAAQTAILCTLSTAERLMAPLRAYEQLTTLTGNMGQIQAAIEGGDYEGAAALLGRTLPTLPAAVNSLRDTARLAQAVGSFDAQTVTDYLQACFAAGTPILGEHGEKSVEDFKVGNLVWARNESDPQARPVLRKIEETFRTEADIWHVHLGGRVIRTTSEHPFWVKGAGWVEAQQLEPGDMLLGLDGRETAVEEVFDTGARETVYNFRVADDHTYFVGSREWGFSVWAHNACIQPVRRPDMPVDQSFRNNRGDVIPVYGLAQNNTGQPNDPHAARIMEEVGRLVETAPAGSYIVLNRSWWTATGRIGTFTLLRPDITFVAELPNDNVRVSAYEIPSGDQTDDELRGRLRQGFSTIAGDIRVSEGELQVIR